MTRVFFDQGFQFFQVWGTQCMIDRQKCFDKKQELVGFDKVIMLASWPHSLHREDSFDLGVEYWQVVDPSMSKACYCFGKGSDLIDFDKDRIGNIFFNPF